MVSDAINNSDANQSEPATGFLLAWRNRTGHGHQADRIVTEIRRRKLLEAKTLRVGDEGLEPPTSCV